MNAPARIVNRPQRRRLSASDFELLTDGGAFPADGKTELIDGEIRVTDAHLSRHARAMSRLGSALAEKLEETGVALEVLVGVAVRLADDSVPEPDIVVTSYTGDRWVPAAEVTLVVEVADATRSRDLGRKAELYAAAGMPEYWVVDLDGARVVRHDGPGAGGYARLTEVPLGERLVSATLTGVEVDTGRLVG